MAKDAGARRVGIWIRVSTEDQVRGESPEVHERRARAYAESRDWAVVEMYRLDAVSGKTVKEHPEAKRMLADIKSGHIQALIFSKLARLARNTRELLEFAELFRESGADLVSLAEAIDTSTPAGRLFYTMIAAMAQWEREEIASRVAASVPVRAQLGKQLGGPAVYGYAWVDKEFRIDPKESPVRKLMYELFLLHGRKKVVARRLNESGYRTRNGSEWTDTTIDRLLRDPTAKGERRANYTVSKDNKKAWALKPKSDWVLSEVEPIVSVAVWEEVNVRLDAMRLAGKRVTKPVVHLFSGLAHCACGPKMYVPSDSHKYTCKVCRRKIPVETLEAIFREELRSFVFSPEEIRQHTAAGTQQVSELSALLEKLTRDQDKVRSDTDKLIELYQAGVLDKAGFGGRYKSLSDRLAQLETEIPSLEGKRDALRIALLSQEEVLSGSRDLVDRWPSLPASEKRSLVETIVARVIVEDTAVEFEFLYSPGNPTSLPSGSGPSGTFGPGTGSNSAMKPHSCVALLPGVKRNRKVKLFGEPTTIGEHIRLERTKRRLLQREAGELLGVGPETVLHWEHGQTEPLAKDGPAIVKFLGYLPLPTTTLAEKMRAVRFLNGWTMAEAAREAGVSPDGWTVWEGGGTPMPGKMRVLENLIASLGRL